MRITIMWLFYLISVTMLATEALAEPSSGCPDGWEKSRADETCLRAFPNKYSYSNALSKCTQRNGQLVEIISDDMNDQVKGLMVAVTRGSYWIGVVDLDEDETWTYNFGDPLSYQKWADFEPNNWDGSEFCTVGLGANFDANGDWSTQPCDGKYGFVCQIEAGDFEGGCELDYHFMPESGMCLGVHDEEKVTFNKAIEICADNFGELVMTFETDDQFDFLASLLEKNEDYWVGIGQRDKYTNYQLLNGTPLTLDRFKKRNRHECVQMRNGQLTDRVCGSRKRFVCQKPPSDFPVITTPSVITTTPS